MRKRNAKRYYTGKPCKRGHVAERLVSNRTCVVCNRDHVKKWLGLRPDIHRAASRKYAKTERGKKWRRDDPRRKRAHDLAQRRLVKQPCWCGNPKTQAHHEDYSKPLDVVWLCAKHHNAHHREARRAKA